MVQLHMQSYPSLQVVKLVLAAGGLIHQGSSNVIAFNLKTHPISLYQVMNYDNNELFFPVLHCCIFIKYLSIHGDLCPLTLCSVQLKMVLIKCCDISNEVRPMEVAEPWVDCLLEEYFMQVGPPKWGNIFKLFHFYANTNTSTLHF